MSYALLFSGQASQHPAMLPWLESERAADVTLQAMSARIGSGWRQSLQDAEQRSDNSFAQVLITGTALAAWAVLRDRLAAPPAAVAGYSVGELSAFACAGVVSVDQALALAVQRAASMDQAVAGVATGLLSVSGLPEPVVLARCTDLGLVCAIRVGVNQAIFAGTQAALAQAAPALAALGAVCTLLAVRVASHSPWMAPAARAFAETLEAVPFSAPHCPIGLNAYGMLCREPGRLRQGLSAQIASTVQWSSCMDAIAERQVTCVLEVGAGAALARMWNDRHPHIPARSLDDFQQAQGALSWIEMHQDT